MIDPEPEHAPADAATLAELRKMAAADLGHYWREAGYEAEQPLPAPRPRAWRAVEKPQPTPSVPLQLGDVACSPVRWDGPADEPTCMACARPGRLGARCQTCGGRVVA